MKSRSFSEELVRLFKQELQDRGNLSFQEATNATQKNLFVEVSKKDPLITVAWEDEDPEFAKKLLEEALRIATEKMAEHASQKKSLQVNFLEQRVLEAQKELSKSEEDLKRFQLDNQGVEIGRQAEALINQIQALTEAQQGKEVDLNVSRNFLSPEAQEVKMLELTVEEMKEKIGQLIGKAKSESDTYLPGMDERSLMDIPKIGLDYARKLRQVNLNQKIYGILLEQLEISKIEAQKEVESFEVIDPPLAPEKRIKPKRTQTVAVAGVASGMLAVMLVLLAHFVANIKTQRALKSRSVVSGS